MNNLLPNTTTATELQRNYKKVVKRAKRIKGPLTVLSNNKPQLIVMDYASFNKKKQQVKPEIHISGKIEHATRKKKKYADFSEFFGIWTKEEAEEFERNTAIFEKIDDEMWRT